MRLIQRCTLEESTSKFTVNLLLLVICGAFERCHPRVPDARRERARLFYPLSLNQSSQSRHHRRQRRLPTQKAKRKKIVTAFTEEQKEGIIKFHMRNEVLYSKRLAGFKDVTKKEDLWAAQAAKIKI